MWAARRPDVGRFLHLAHASPPTQAAPKGHAASFARREKSSSLRLSPFAKEIASSPPVPISVLLLGGAGVFGSRICRRLARHEDFRIVAAGRRRAPLEALARDLRQVEPLVLDAPRALGAALRDRRPDLMIHTAGPFQAQDYAVVELCIAAGIHYIDIADGRDFVANFTRLDAAARGALTARGARPCLDLFTLDELRTEVADLDVADQVVTSRQRAARRRSASPRCSMT